MEIKSSYFIRATLIGFTILNLLSGCTKGTDARDPYENFNRKMYSFNTALDKAIFKPIATGYNKVIPSPIRQGVTNFYSNLSEIPSIAANLLQGNWHGAGNSTGRFVFNSTFGLAGIIDVAKHMNLEENQTDLGVTFAKWGDRNSPFIVLPFMGPTTIRDFSGFVFDFTLLSPFFYIDNTAIRWSATGLWIINRRASILNMEKVLDEITIDPYLLQRDAYLQYRDNRIRRALGEEELDTYVEGDDVAETTTSEDKTIGTKENTTTTKTEGEISKDTAPSKPSLPAGAYGN